MFLARSIEVFPGINIRALRSRLPESEGSRSIFPDSDDPRFTTPLQAGVPRREAESVLDW